MMPRLDITVTTEVVDDEDQHVVTAGAIITVTLVLVRKTMESILSKTDALEQQQPEDADEAEDKDAADDSDDIVELHAPTDDKEDGEKAAEEEAKKKTPVWKKPEKKKKAGKKGGGGGGGGGKQKQKQKSKPKQSGAAAEGGGDHASAQVQIFGPLYALSKLLATNGGRGKKSLVTNATTLLSLSLFPFPSPPLPLVPGTFGFLIHTHMLWQQHMMARSAVADLLDCCCRSQDKASETTSKSNGQLRPSKHRRKNVSLQLRDGNGMRTF